MSRTRWTRRRPGAVLAAVVGTVALLMTGVLTGTASAEPVRIPNGTQFTDTDGNPLHAHGGGVLKVGDYYYWFGENRNPDFTFRHVSAYRSTDLRNWEFRNHVLTQDSDPELAVANIERPKVIYNESTGQFVMWMHKENGRDYGEARAAVAVSDTVDGDYEWRGSFRPFDEHMSRDITAFVDGDGTGYMISSARENYDLHVYRLTPDYTQVEELVHVLWPGGHREAPAMFERDGVYFLVTSGATGWNPNQQKYATAECVECPWTEPTNLGNSTAFGSQTAFVLPVEGSETTGYLYMGDRWGPAQGGTPNDSEYVWLPLEFPTPTSLTMDWTPELEIDTATGRISGLDGGQARPVVARHSSKCLDVADESTAEGHRVIQWECTGGNNQRWVSRDVGGGHVELVAWHSGRCLTVEGGSTSDGGAVTQRACTGEPHQQWRAEDADAGHVRYVARHSGLCLDVADESTANNATVHQWSCGTGPHQQWSRG
ncbi:RICIN domain-containing protein [Actinoalloteichus caeruleus]|uniref:Glycosyl hydrolases family 43 n=1 Tax=Actinoalloteichus caeruleus DSM 43889 TaxID=1120930 RepID=A0ABT1JFT5_ACTCY|nr:RICIN domain-containing protein [Actinoalloteichus caeruleus]MCP2331358.1 Glycosyl hydrolases family 43 [Actinoalloteichus caeruleus DSM 43889]